MSGGVWILGGGLIGCGWAVSWAVGRYAVTVIDPDPTAGVRLAQLWPRAFAGLERLGLHGPRPPLPRLVADAADAGPPPLWVQENLPEDLDLKRAALATLEGWLDPGTVIASSTSVFAPDEVIMSRAACSSASVLLWFPTVLSSSSLSVSLQRR